MSVQSLKDMLIREEGEVLHEYKDHLGYSTIGVGRLIDKRRGGGITHEEAMYLLDNDIKKVKRQILDKLPWVTQLSECRQAVLESMAFQMGVDGLLHFDNTLKYIKERQYTRAASAMMASLWATQTPARAQRLSNQMATDQWQ